jgi:hypothetical protein
MTAKIRTAFAVLALTTSFATLAGSTEISFHDNGTVSTMNTPTEKYLEAIPGASKLPTSTELLDDYQHGAEMQRAEILKLLEVWFQMLPELPRRAAGCRLHDFALTGQSLVTALDVAWEKEPALRSINAPDALLLSLRHIPCAAGPSSGNPTSGAPAIQTNPVGSPGQPAFASGIYRNRRETSRRETNDSDMLWEKEINAVCEGGPVAPRGTDDPRLNRCVELQETQPPCVSYSSFAAVYFRSASDGTLSYTLAKQVWANGKAKGQYTDDFYNSIGSLIDIAYQQRNRWRTADDFKDDAYKACMMGHLLSARGAP